MRKRRHHRLIEVREPTKRVVFMDGPLAGDTADVPTHTRRVFVPIPPQISLRLTEAKPRVVVYVETSVVTESSLSCWRLDG